jgi:threonine synthase
MELYNPTGCFKDRSMAVGVAKAVEFGAPLVALSSAGNAGASCAAYAAQAGLGCVVVVPDGTPPERLVQIQVLGGRVICMQGTTSDAAEMLGMAADRFGWHVLTTAAAINPYQADGTRTLAYELARRWSAPPDWIVCPVGGGGLLVGIASAMIELRDEGLIADVPRMLAVQPSGCAPVVAALRHGGSGHVASWDASTSSVWSLADPVPLDGELAVAAVHATRGAAIDVSDDAIAEMQIAMGWEEGIFAEPAGATAMAGLAAAINVGMVSKGSQVMAIITGAGLKDVRSVGTRLEAPLVIRKGADDVLEAVEKWVGE